MNHRLIISLLPIAIIAACSGVGSVPIPDPAVTTVVTYDAGNKDASDASDTDASDASDADATDAADADAAPSCVPHTDGFICNALQKKCGPANVPLDNCNKPRAIANCGACKTKETCNAAGICECIPDSDAVLCAALNKECGTVSTFDNCFKVRNNVVCPACLPDLPGVTPACVNNACDYSNCSPGYTRCPNQPPGPAANGCQNLQTDANNCGVCNVACLPGKACVAGVCAP